MNDLQDIITANNHAFLVGLVKKQAAKLDAIARVAEKFDNATWGMEDVDQTGPLADEAINDIQALLGGWS